MLLLAGLLAAAAGAAGARPVVFPGAHWQARPPAALDLDAAALDELEKLLGGRGCVIRDGYVAKTWGDQAQRGDWLSSAKPVLSTLLFFALQEGLVRSVDQPIADFGWELAPKDRAMTFRHLGAMTSGYARPEPPGRAWSYNDYAIQLYQKTLFDKVFRADPKAAAEHPARLGALGLEDGVEFDAKRRRLSASGRDFARIGWFWLNRGRWGSRQVLARRYFDDYMRPQVPANLLNTEPADTNDYLGIGSYGGGSDHFSRCGAGIHGFNWWFNGRGRSHPHLPTWPDAPPDTVMSIGAGGNCAALMPSLNLVLVCAQGHWGELAAGDRSCRMNRALGLVARAAGYRAPRVFVSGELRRWHPVTLSLVGPKAEEQGEVNPFTDYRLTVTFAGGGKRHVVPGYFAADGNAAETGAEGGSIWRVHFLPDREGVWRYRISLRTGPGVALDPDATGKPCPGDGLEGSFGVGPGDRAAKGVLRHAGGRYLQFAGTGEHFLKGGADSPENLLAFADFDQTPPSHRFAPHIRDWRPGDSTWGEGKGKGLIGALNYLAAKGMNSVYFLTMNVEGDGKDVWPWTSPEERLRFDCSKLGQWEIAFSHMDRKGIMLHVVTQEQENDQLLDDGELGPQRGLYYRELVARFGHHPALVWNLGEENTNTDAQRRAFASYLRRLDPYGHPIVVHTFPSQIEQVYGPLLGFPDLDGPSLQLGHMERTYRETYRWVTRSQQAGRPWFVCLDEIGPADTGVKPDADDPRHDDVRRHALWGNLMAGGAGVEWLFGYGYPHHDISCEDWRSRDRMWDLTRYALDFFRRHLPFAQMQPAPQAVQGGEAWCLARAGEVYAVYAPRPAETRLRLSAGSYQVHWYNPRAGGALLPGETVRGPGRVPLGAPPGGQDQDWAALVRRTR